MRLPKLFWHSLAGLLIYTLPIALACADAAFRPTHRHRRRATFSTARATSCENRRIVVEGSKIVAIEPYAAGPTPAKEAGMGHPRSKQTAAQSGPVDYDLRGLTVLPGWIDAHVHITWIFGKDGKNAGTTGTTQDDAYKAASNAWVTLMAGFTTVQSVGAPNDVPLRDAIARGRDSRAAHPDRG